LGEQILFRDQDEWPQEGRFQVGDPVLHIELRRWAELLVIAPLDANTLAKLALGLCDNLLTCVYRAWEPDRPILLAPAMNTRMWEHPATVRHLRQLLEDHGGTHPLGSLDPEELCETINATCPRLRVAPPQSKRLACGDEGQGAMADVAQIAVAVEALFAVTKGQ
jgi:phosphopantothenoylcysteine decarboxylase